MDDPGGDEPDAPQAKHAPDLKRYRLPAMLVVAALLIGAAAWSRFDSPAPKTRSASTGSKTRKSATTLPRQKKPKSTTSAAPTTTVVANPTAYANALYGYWTERDRESAARVATPAVVEKLFTAVWHESGGWTAQGCKGAATTTSCTWARKHRELVMTVRNATGALAVLVVAVSINVVG